MFGISLQYSNESLLLIQHIYTVTLLTDVFVIGSKIGKKLV